MRPFVTRTLSLVLVSLIFVLPVSFFGQDQKSKKPAPSSGKALVEKTFKADESPVIKVDKPIRKERNTPSGHKADAIDGDTKPVETPGFRVMSRPREDRLMRGKPFHGDLRALPQIRPEKFERPEFEEPQVTPVPYPGTTAPSSSQTTPAGASSPTPSVPAPSPSSSFEGLDFLNWGAGHPPDTNGDVGPTYYIQTINTSIGIFRKSDGVRVAAFTFNTFFNGHFGNLCDTNNFGDPVVLYDTFEDRWVITDFAFRLSGGNPAAPVFQCFAVSQSGDPVGGGWNFYSIQTATTATDAFDDYPKFGIWPDGLYMSANMFNITGGAFRNVRVWAFNKTQMYAGAPTIQILSFDAPAAEFTMLPSNARLQAGTPPTGTPNYFTTVFNFTNAVSTYKFHADWTNAANSTFSGPFITIAPAPWANAPGSVATPAPGTNIETLATRLMVQNQYSNIGGVESLWDTHTVRGTVAGTAAPRFYQVDVTGGTVAATTTQAATFNPDASAINRFMPSVAVDRAGDMAIGYTAASSTFPLLPAMRYAGQLAGDPVNTITQTETSLIEGTGTQQTAAFTRWGDYSAMSLDPDGCTFWNTNMYYQVNGVNFNTRIGAFSFPSCTPVGAGGAISGTVTNAGTGNPISGVTVALGARTTTTDINGAYSFAALPAGTYPSITATFPGFSTGATFDVLVSDGSTTTVNFSLTAAATSGCFLDTSQADFQNGTATNCDLITSPDNIILRSGPAVDQQNTTLGNNGVGISTATWGGQTFTPSVTGLLTRVDVSLFCSQCTAGTQPDLTLSVRATSGGLPTGADIASATITNFTSGAAGFHTATFSSPPTLTAGTQYAFVIRPNATQTAPAIYALTRSATNVYAGGQRVSSADSGTTWTAPLTAGQTTDAGFFVFMDAGFAPSGTFISSLKDANPAPGNTANWGMLSWVATTPPNTNVQFQIAASNNALGPFSFVGPDGTAGTFFSNGASLAQFNNFRYLKYQATLSSSDNTQTPSLDSVSTCFNNVAGVLAPSIVKKFGAASAIPLNGTTSLTFTITNDDATNSLTGVAFTDNLPAGLVVASTPNLSNSCGGTATAIGGSSSVSLTGGTLAGGASCIVSATVQGTTAGVKNNSVQITSAEGGTGNTSNAAITVVAPPVIIKAFGAASIPLNGSTSLQFTLQNNNTASSLTGVAFSDTLPAGLVVATPNGLAGNTCGRTPTAVAGSSSVSISLVTLAASSSCTFTINVTGTAAGLQSNTTGNVTSTEGGTGGTASASVKVEAPPSIAKVFDPSTIALNATTSLTFTITNPAANVDPLAGVAFTDSLPTGLTVANASATVCGGTLTTTPPTGIALSGATIAANSQCQLSVTVTGAAAGNYTNTTGNVTSTNGGTGNTATADLSVTKGNQTITFGALAGKTFGDADFDVSATASSGLTVSFAASGNCTLAGSTVHITGAGSCTITASQAGDSNYNPAPDVPQSFTIAKADQTITFAALAGKTFGNPDFAVSATASSSLTVSFAASGSCTVAGATVHLTGAGSCTITASQAGNVNYNPAAGVPQSFSIAKATPTLTVTCPSGGVFDGNLHECTAAALGVGGATVSGSAGITYSGSPDDAPPAAAGTYPVSATFISDDASYNNATGSSVLVIGKANPTVTVICPAGVIFNGNPHTCTSAATGVGNAGVAGAATLTYNGGAAPSNAGTYAVIASFTSGDSNYNDAAGSSSLTIAKAGQTITFGALPAKNLGNPDFTVAATASSGLAVSFSASGTCSVTGATVHLISVGSCTITAAQAGNANINAAASVPQSFAITSDDFGIAPTLPSVTVTAGQSITEHISVTPNPSTSTALTFSCSGLPAKSTCTFAPNPVPPGSTPTDVVMTITTTASTTAALRRPRTIYAAWLGFASMGLVGVVVIGASRKGRRKAAILGAFALMMVLLTLGCGGGSMHTPVTVPGTPTGTSTVTVTGTTTGFTHSTTFTLTVN